MNKLITILARKGSKGLPGKSQRRIAGRSLIQWTVDQAHAYKDADIVISTDIIMKEAIGVKILKRPANLATDKASKLDAIYDAVKKSEQANKKKYQIIIDLDVTNPLRKEGDIAKVVNVFIDNHSNTAFSVVKSRCNPYFNMVEMRDDRPILCKSIYGNTPCRRQDVPYCYDMTASIYVYDATWLKRESNISPISEKSNVCVMEDWQGFNIDTKLDFDIVEMLIKKHLDK